MFNLCLTATGKKMLLLMACIEKISIKHQTIYYIWRVICFKCPEVIAVVVRISNNSINAISLIKPDEFKQLDKIDIFFFLLMDSLINNIQIKT